MKRLILMVALPLFLVSCDGGNAMPGSSSISGRVYCDQNQNHICDCEEGGLKDIPVRIFADHCGGTPLQTTSTDEQGNFSFRDFEPGTYFVRADLEYVCGGRMPTGTTCQQVDMTAGGVIELEAFSFTEYGQ